MTKSAAQAEVATECIDALKEQERRHSVVRLASAGLLVAVILTCQQSLKRRLDRAVTRANQQAHHQIEQLTREVESRTASAQRSAVRLGSTIDALEYAKELRDEYIDRATGAQAMSLAASQLIHALNVRMP